MDLAALGTATALGAAAALWRDRRVFFGFALLQTWYVCYYFPLTGNHRYLEVLLAVLLGMFDERNAVERRLLLRAVRWTVVVVLFYSGLQKLTHGYFIDGQFLAWSLWRDSFRTALAPLLPADELVRLTGYGALPGDGPYRVVSPLFVMLSNGVWLAEISLALALFLRPRPVAWVLACVFMVGTQVVARELFFGIEFIAAILLFARRNVLSPIVRPVAVLLVLGILVRLGWLPQVIFH